MNSRITEKLKEWQRSPLLFVKECIEVTPSSQQAEGLIAIAKNKRVSIRSGHGTGKDALASWAILWFMSTRPYPRVVCTAPTWRQLNDVLWSELSKWLRKSILKDEFIIQKDKMFHKDAPKEWWCRAVSPSVKASKEDQAETLAGFHADHMLIICDEASGIPDPVFIPLEGAMTQEDNKVLLIGNPTKNIGYFHETQFDPKLSSSWKKLHWDSRKSTNVHPDMVNYFKLKYGEDSNVFRIRVAGEPPLDDENTLIPLSWSLQCIKDIEDTPEIAEDEPLFLGVDVARYGDDKSIILPRKGVKIYPWESYKGMNTIHFGSFINQTYSDLEAEGIAIDEIGVGAGVTDWLYKHGRTNTFGVNVARASSDKAKYDRLRDELWIRVKEKCMNGVYSFPSSTAKERELSNELCNELSSPTYDFNKQGGIVVESKRQMKARGVMSPNIADALCLTEYFSSVAHALWETKKKTKKSRRDKNSNRNSWMYC